MKLKNFRFLLIQLICCSGSWAFDETWSIQVQPEVRTLEGFPAVLPCSFTHPHHSAHASMNVVWRLGHAHSSTELFRCSSRNGSQECQTEPDQDQRYRLEGNHKQHDLSLRISSTALQDSGRYFCRVELPDQPHAIYENKIGSHLRVEAPPQILTVSIGGSVDTRLKALCRVQGSPLPDVVWTNLDKVLDGDNGPPLLQRGLDRHRITSQLLEVHPGGQYTCTASNPHGKDQASLYILPMSPEMTHTLKSNSRTVLLLLGLALAAKALLFLSVGVWLIRRNIKASA